LLETLEPLTVYFDARLGRPLAMIDLGLFGHAQAALQPMIRAGSAGPSKLPQKLWCLACHGQASAALPHEDFETVVHAVEAAELWGTVAVYDPQPFAYDFIQLIAACCGGIAKSVGASELSRSAACTLLRRLRQAAPPNRVPELERVVKSICEEHQAL